jgi:hypothetical protein
MMNRRNFFSAALVGFLGALLGKLACAHAKVTGDRLSDETLREITVRWRKGSISFECDPNYISKVIDRLKLPMSLEERKRLGIDLDCEANLMQQSERPC